MKTFSYKCTLAMLALVISGCAGLAEMKPVERIGAAETTMALVNFARPRVFAGDGVKLEVWDGANFVGTLKAGTMVQYVALPGDHVFMIDPTQEQPWGYMNINLEAGKVYYIKPNLIPFVGLMLGVASSSDSRIEEWNTSLEPMAVDRSTTRPVPQERIDEAKRNLDKFKKP